MVRLVVNYPCLKGDGTTDVKPGSPCADKIQSLTGAGAKVVTAIKSILPASR